MASLSLSLLLPVNSGACPRTKTSSKVIELQNIRSLTEMCGFALGSAELVLHAPHTQACYVMASTVSTSASVAKFICSDLQGVSKLNALQIHLFFPFIDIGMLLSTRKTNMRPNKYLPELQFMLKTRNWILWHTMVVRYRDDTVTIPCGIVNVRYHIHAITR